MSNLLDDELITLAEAAAFMREKFPRVQSCMFPACADGPKKASTGGSLRQ